MDISMLLGTSLGLAFLALYLHLAIHVIDTVLDLLFPPGNPPAQEFSEGTGVECLCCGCMDAVTSDPFHTDRPLCGSCFDRLMDTAGVVDESELFICPRCGQRGLPAPNPYDCHQPICQECFRLAPDLAQRSLARQDYEARMLRACQLEITRRQLQEAFGGA